MTESEPRRRRNAAGQNPMEEENFPTDSPTRDAVEREMSEPSNVRGSSRPVPRRDPRVKELGDGSPAVDEE